MSKRKSEDPHGGAKEGESEEEEGLFPPKVPRVATSTELPTEEQPGPSHRVFPVQRGEPVEFGAMRGLPQPSLRTRGPGRPRIHPPKPAGVSRPRGRPKGSKNKKPRKRKEVVRIERPPKRPRGRPRKWPPEMWEGFQRTREAAVQQQLKQQQQQQQQQHHIQQHHEMAGPSHMYMEQQRDPRILQQMQMVHPHQMPPQPPMPHYMQLPLETEQPQEEISLLMPPQSLPQEHMLPSMMLPEQQHPEQIQEQEELLWMPHEEMPPHHQRPPHTTSQ